jgi:hypothetical protein
MDALREVLTITRDQHLRERAYILWQQDGSPEGRAEEYWNRTHDFQAY